MEPMTKAEIDKFLATLEREVECSNPLCNDGLCIISGEPVRDCTLCLSTGKVITYPFYSLRLPTVPYICKPDGSASHEGIIYDYHSSDGFFKVKEGLEAMGLWDEFLEWCFNDKFNFDSVDIADIIIDFTVLPGLAVEYLMTLDKEG